MRIEQARLPRRLASQTRVAAGLIQQIDEPDYVGPVDFEIERQPRRTIGRVTLAEGGRRLTLIPGNVTRADDPTTTLKLVGTTLAEPENCLSEPTNTKWAAHPAREPARPPEFSREIASHFQLFVDVDSPSNLRTPQLGAFFSVLSHWTVSSEPATVVMPTGTGKTETMLCILARGGIEKLLVLVPNDQLRQQTYEKFLTLGKLVELGILSSSAPFPIVGRLEHGMRSLADAEAMFAKCDVVVGTIQAFTASVPEAKARAVELISHVFLDEAHHVAARTWAEAKDSFISKPILQFTATPFRRDGKRVDGRVIYVYPLKLAHEHRYFPSIRFKSVFELGQEASDSLIAQEAVSQLRQDLDGPDNLDHLLMARVKTIERAVEVLPLYEAIAHDLNPVVIHSGLRATERSERLARVRSRQSRILICVDMFGEGFDLPQLKVAAMHDMHRSLAITLQFIGRFARSLVRVGQATLVANTLDPVVDDALRELYSEEKDWNSVLQRIGDDAIEVRRRDAEFLTSFNGDLASIALESLVPAMSTVVYQTQCEDWAPHRIAELVGADLLFQEPLINEQHRVALFVTHEYSPIEWGRTREIRNLIWHLFVLFWDEERKLLYINSSNKDSFHEVLANQVCGDNAARITGEPVYRCLAGINRLLLMNLGLKYEFGRNIRHEMLNGTDVASQLTLAHIEGKSKTNLFGRGYENGERTSIGCSSKGRIWAHQDADGVHSWIDWCRHLGPKLLDNAITEEQVLQGVLIPTPVTERPELVPLALDWNTDTYRRNQQTLRIRLGGNTYSFYELELSLRSSGTSGPIEFLVKSETTELEYEAIFENADVFFRPRSAEDATVILPGGRQMTLEAFFMTEPPSILFENSTWIEDYSLYTINRQPVPFDAQRLVQWDWQGIDLHKESQGYDKIQDSIQFKVIQALCEAEWEFVFNDDDAGETADVLAFKRTEEWLDIEMYHCKYATDGRVGHRYGDLTEVCGQVQKSVRWRADVEALLRRLKIRETKRIREARTSRIEKGSVRLLANLINASRILRPRTTIVVVQPGVSKSRLIEAQPGTRDGDTADAQLRLLAATDLYLQETHGISFRVICNE